MFRLCLTFLSTVLIDATKPNFLVMLADDLGYADVGFHSSIPLTPNIDSLAQEGVILEQFYVSPVCSPTRSSMMTGRYTYRLGTQATVIRADVPFGVPLEEMFLPQNLKMQGYRTALFGKWHLGFYQQAYTPMARGFDEHMGYFQGQVHYYTHQGYDYTHQGREGMDWHRGNQTDFFGDVGNYTMPLLVEATVDFLNRMAEGSDPFFLYLSWHLVHHPLEVDDEYRERYPQLSGNQQTMMGMVAALDDGIGEVMDALRGHPDMYANTIVLFTSDNGAANLGGSNFPLKGWKTNTYEGGIRASAFVHSPLLPASVRGTASMKLFHIVDLLPTFVALAGGSVDENLPLDGSDIWEAITTLPEESGGVSSPHQELLLNLNPSCHKGFVAPNAAMRVGAWKLLVDCFNYTTMSATGLVELYNIANDPNESSNLAGNEPDKVEELLERLAIYAGSADQTPPVLFPGVEGWNYQCPQCPSGGAFPSPFVSPQVQATCSVEDNTGFAGNDIRKVANISSGTACCAACSVEPTCKAWTLVPGKNCWLKTSDAGRKQATDAISGLLGFAPTPPPPTFNPWCDDVVCVPGTPPPRGFSALDAERLAADESHVVDPSAGNVQCGKSNHDVIRDVTV